MAGKSRTEEERARMMARCEAIALKYRETSTYADPAAPLSKQDFTPNLPPDMQRNLALAKEQETPSTPSKAQQRRASERAAERNRRFGRG